MREAAGGGLIDVTRTLDGATACWPGDVPYEFAWGATIAGGASVNVGWVRMSIHAGTHCDAPLHVRDGGPGVGALPLGPFLGPAWVVDVAGLDRWGERLAGLDLEAAPRVLFRTGGWPDSARFPERIPVMEPGLAEELGRRGVVLVGVDVPSVDPLDARELPRHQALLGQGMVIVEGLWLEGVRPGRYEFVGLPLKLAGADGSPVRAVLRGGPAPSG